MAALLVALAVMAILMTVAMPTWRQAAQREREEELIFRGRQYARAVELFQRKYANAFPPNFDVLVEQRFLRRKYRDPMVEDGEFQPLYQVDMRQVAGGQGRSLGGSMGLAPGGQAQSAQSPTAPGSSFATGGAGGQSGTSGPRGGVIGVVSKSKDKSIRLYNGRNNYNAWEFVYVPLSIGPGGMPGGGQGPGRRGGAGMGPGGMGGGRGQGGRGQGGQRGMGPGGPQRGPGGGVGPGSGGPIGPPRGG
jgi:type II secretory pathway pseudopilin PulG